MNAAQKVTRRDTWTTEQGYEVEFTYMQDDDENNLFIARTRHQGAIVEGKSSEAPEFALGDLSAKIGVRLVIKSKSRA